MTHPNSLKNLAPPFKPGQSGNPGGRPRRKPMRDRVLDLMARPVRDFPRVEKYLKGENAKGKPGPKGAMAKPEDIATMDLGDAFVLASFIHSMEGKPGFFGELFDRADGKVVQEMMVAMEDRRPRDWTDSELIAEATSKFERFITLAVVHSMPASQDEPKGGDSGA